MAGNAGQRSQPRGQRDGFSLRALILYGMMPLLLAGFAMGSFQAWKFAANSESPASGNKLAVKVEGPRGPVEGAMVFAIADGDPAAAMIEARLDAIAQKRAEADRLMDDVLAYRTRNLDELSRLADYSREVPPGNSPVANDLLLAQARLAGVHLKELQSRISAEAPARELANRQADALMEESDKMLADCAEEARRALPSSHRAKTNSDGMARLGNLTAPAVTVYAFPVGTHAQALCQRVQLPSEAQPARIVLRPIDNALANRTPRTSQTPNNTLDRANH